MAVKKGTKYFNNGQVTIRVAPGKDIPNGFVEGRLIIKKSDGIHGKKAYHCGDIVKYFSETDVIPNGFVLGTSDRQKEKLKKNSLEIAKTTKGKPKSESTKEKIRLSAIERLKDKTNHPMFGRTHSDESKLHISNSKKGIPSPFKGVNYTLEQKEQLTKTKMLKYGSIEKFNEQVIKASKETKLERYGDETYNNHSKASETIQNIIDSGVDFWGNRNKKTKQTIESKYGSKSNFYACRMANAANNGGFKSVDDYLAVWAAHIKRFQSKHSKLEKKFAEFLDDALIPYKQHYLISNDSLSHEFDFALLKNNNVTMLVDCDGKFYHGYLSDNDGKKVNNYTDDYRVLLVPDKVKFFVLVEGEDEILSDIMLNYNTDFDNYVNYIFNWCRSIDFPYPKYSDKILHNSFEKLLSVECPISYNCRQLFGMKIVNHFHPSIYHANRINKISPFNAWYDDNLLKTAIKNRLIYKGSSLDASRVLSGFSASGIAPKVSIFNPFLAKYIIKKYLDVFDVVFDPFSGFSGRMLGCCSLNKLYIGQDINAKTIDESKCIKNYFNLNAKLYSVDSTTTFGSYGCLFTCPPYGAKENWGNDYPIIKSCDEWIDVCLNNYDCKRYVFVVDETVKFNSFIQETLINKSHFGKNYEYIVVINK